MIAGDRDDRDACLKQAADVAFEIAHCFKPRVCTFNDIAGEKHSVDLFPDC